jgi:hypothetical protein
LAAFVVENMPNKPAPHPGVLAVATSLPLGGVDGDGGVNGIVNFDGAEVNSTQQETESWMLRYSTGQGRKDERMKGRRSGMGRGGLHRKQSMILQSLESNLVAVLELSVVYGVLATTLRMSLVGWETDNIQITRMLSREHLLHVYHTVDRGTFLQ